MKEIFFLFYYYIFIKKKFKKDNHYIEPTDTFLANNQPINKDELNNQIYYSINEVNSGDKYGNYFDPISYYEINEQITTHKTICR